MEFTHTVDLSLGMADTVIAGEEMTVQVAVPVIIHKETGRIVWQSSSVVPFSVEDWLARSAAYLSTLRVHMERWWPEVAVYVDWWLIEPGNEHYPEGLRC